MLRKYFDRFGFADAEILKAIKDNGSQRAMGISRLQEMINQGAVLPENALSYAIEQQGSCDIIKCLLDARSWSNTDKNMALQKVVERIASGHFWLSDYATIQHLIAANADPENEEIFKILESGRNFHQRMDLAKVKDLLYIGNTWLDHVPGPFFKPKTP